MNDNGELTLLFERARGGDEGALEALVAWLLGRLRPWAERLLGPGLRHRVDASDVAQEVCLRIHGAFARLPAERAGRKSMNERQGASAGEPAGTPAEILLAEFLEKALAQIQRGEAVEVEAPLRDRPDLWERHPGGGGPLPCRALRAVRRRRCRTAGAGAAVSPGRPGARGSRAAAA
jgi:hypothetical protein